MGSFRGAIILIVLFVSVLFPAKSSAKTWYINPSGTGDAPTIQAGIDSTGVGDTLMLLAGTFVGPGNRSVDFKGKTITVTSSAGPEVTIIDAEFAANGFFFQNGEGSGAVVSGVTIQNGQGITGGNIKCVDSSPTITGCILRWGRGEAAYGGAGIQCQGTASPFIELNSFIENLSPIGAGVACYGGASPTINQNIFTGNSTQDGGGIGKGAGVYCEYNSDPIVTDNIFMENEGGFGGAILCHRNSNPVIDGNEIVGNSAVTGGGIFCNDSSPTISNNVICDNVATGGGGAIYCGGSSPHIINNTMVGNSEVAIWCFRNPTPTDPTIERNIVVFSSIGPGILCSNPEGGYPPNPTLSCNVVFGNEGGDTLCGTDGGGNLELDPLFCGVIGSGNYYLRSDSPCLPGNNACGVLIGALPGACGNTPIRKSTWGSIKAKLR